MSTILHVLVAVDDTAASERAVEAAARHIEGHPQRHVFLFHLLPTIPTELLEFGGRADHDEERRGLEELRQKRHAWMAEAREQAQPLFDRYHRILWEAGVSEDRIEDLYDAPDPECSVAQEILSAARGRSIETIFVGRHAFPRHKTMFRRHVGEELANKARSEDVLIIGGPGHA